MQFIYGESIESTGGNPEEAGTFKRVFFLDPFVVGDRMEHALLFYDIIRRNRIRCYLANTGALGDPEQKVTLRQSLAVYSDILRVQLRFGSDPDHLGYHYPIKSDRANMDLMSAHAKFPDPERLKKKVADFLKGRRAYLEAFEAKWGAVPDHIRESLPYRHDQIDFAYLEKEASNGAE
jgi:phosphoenolpyruvate carboxykinase (ATP)